MSFPSNPIESYGATITFLGEGSYSRVIGTDKGYAIKVTRNHSAGIPDSTTLHEIVSLNKARSKYVIPLIDVIFSSQATNLIIPLSPGELSPKDVKRPKKIIQELLLGLNAIHNANLLHLDIKPENILLQEGVTTGDIWIADLGLSEVHTCAFPPMIGSFYTIYYRPPECLLGGPISEKSDIWALGVVFAEILMSRNRRYNKLLFDIDSEEGLIQEQVFLFGPYPSYLRWPNPDDLSFDKEGVITPYIKDLIDKGMTEEEASFILRILKIDPDKRPSINEILQDPFLQLDEVDITTCYDKLLNYSYSQEDKWGRHKKNRNTVINWMIELKEHFRLEDDALSLGVYLIDKVIGLQNIRTKDIQIYATACLYLAAHFQDIRIFKLKDALESSPDTFEEEEFTSVLSKILRTINYDLSPATSYTFLSYNITRNPYINEAKVMDIWTKSLLTDFHFREPSLVADAILELAKKPRNLSSETKELKEEISLLK